MYLAERPSRASKVHVYKSETQPPRTVTRRVVRAPYLGGFRLPILVLVFKNAFIFALAQRESQQGRG